MQERIELRFLKEYAHLLLQPGEGKDLGLVISVEIPTNDPRIEKVRQLREEIRSKHDDFFFLYSEIKRKYSKKELDQAVLFHLKINPVFEPPGELCGTLYDETLACEFCGANRKQVSPLKLKKGTIPKKDIARTIAGEVVVSEKLVEAAKRRNLKGLQFSGTNVEKYFQLTAGVEVELSDNTVVGINFFDWSTSNMNEVYKCPTGDTIGLNLISEPDIINSPSIGEYDFYASRQKIGINRGLLRPNPVYFCSQAFRKMIDEERLTGFGFEVATVFEKRNVSIMTK